MNKKAAASTATAPPFTAGPLVSGSDVRNRALESGCRQPRSRCRV